MYKYHLSVTRHQYSRVVFDLEAENDEQARIKAIEVATGLEFPELQTDDGIVFMSPYSEAEYSVDWGPTDRKRLSQRRAKTKRKKS